MQTAECGIYSLVHIFYFIDKTAWSGFLFCYKEKAKSRMNIAEKIFIEGAYYSLCVVIAVVICSLKVL